MESEWIKTLDKIKDQISAGNFKTWFGQTKLELLTDKKLVLKVPSAFIRDQLILRYNELILSTIKGVTSHEIEIQYQINANLFSKKQSQSEEDAFEFNLPPTPQVQTGLNPKYTMESFVVGLTNNLAYAAAQAVIQNPGLSYNPLFIYGPSGVGKTHLMQAIGNAIAKKEPFKRVVFAPSEKFMNDLVTSIQTKQTGDFRSRYRMADVFLIDDIQFIAGRDSTQEEFFHTYNEVYTKNCQIILTSDKPAHEIAKLEDRLRSRFQGGLMVDIQLPDFDTRMAILKGKLTEKGESLPDECLSIIAEHSLSSIRELEGKLTQVIQAVKFQNLVPSPDLVAQVLGQKKVSSQILDQKTVLNGVNNYFNLKMVDLTGPRRQKELVLPRQIAMYILYKDCHIPMEKVGEILGGRDHTTVIHGVRKIEEAITRDREIQRLLIEVKNSLQ